MHVKPVVIFVIATMLNVCIRSPGQETTVGEQAREAAPYSLIVPVGDSPLIVPVGEPPGRARVEDGKEWQNLPIPDAVDTLPEPRRIDGFGRSEQRTRETESAFVSVFEGPCHFAYMGYTRYGEQVPRDAFVIYEGMSVIVSPDGKYEVSFVAESPRLPVVLRLQLQMTERIGLQEHPRGTITLAPIVILPDRDQERHSPATMNRIRRTGYTHLLRQILPEDDSTCYIRRTGSARFGSIPEKADYGPIAASEAE